MTWSNRNRNPVGKHPRQRRNKFCKEEDIQKDFLTPWRKGDKKRKFWQKQNPGDREAKFKEWRVYCHKWPWYFRNDYSFQQSTGHSCEPCSYGPKSKPNNRSKCVLWDIVYWLIQVPFSKHITLSGNILSYSRSSSPSYTWLYLHRDGIQKIQFTCFGLGLKRCLWLRWEKIRGEISFGWYAVMDWVFVFPQIHVLKPEPPVWKYKEMGHLVSN